MFQVLLFMFHGSCFIFKQVTCSLTLFVGLLVADFKVMHSLPTPQPNLSRTLLLVLVLSVCGGVISGVQSNLLMIRLKQPD